jgi:signal transduction histidine kinase
VNFRLQPRSIAFRLIAAVLAVELLSAVLVVALSYGYERHIHFRAFDVMLHGRADSILGAVQDADDPGDNVMLDQADLRIPPEDVYEVWDAEGRLLGRSANLQDSGAWQGSGAGALTHPFGDIFRSTIKGQRYRVLRIQGTRTVDPGEKGGGKLRQVTIVYGSPTSHVWRAIRGAVEFYAAGSVLLLLVTGPLIAWLLHRGLLPLRQLAALASQVSVDSWQFSPPASAHTTPELAPLTHALESVLQRLERSFLQQRAFVSDAAHELKTAVAVIKSSLQLLSMKPRTAKEYQAGLERCLADSHRLEALVADMLALARAESSTPAPGPPPVADLVDCIRQTVSQLETIATLRNVRVVVSMPFQDKVSEPLEKFRVPLAPEDCTLLLCNLLLNALQHSPPASGVEFNLNTDSQAAILVIQDHGDGIPAEALPHVFDRFYRGDPSRTRNTGGTGLGLAIAQAIAQRAGGSVSIASQPDPALPNQGATVTVRLPMVAASPAPTR